MAVTSSRRVSVYFEDDLIATFNFWAANNAAAPGAISELNLVLGDNTITVPAGTVKGATIIPPSGNTASIILKGVTGDTGITLSKTDPTSIAFETAPATFLLVAGGSITGLRIIWS